MTEKPHWKTSYTVVLVLNILYVIGFFVIMKMFA